MSPIRRAGSTVLVAGLLALPGCDHSRGGSTVGPPMQARNSPEAIIALPLGDIAGARNNLPYSKDVYRFQIRTAATRRPRSKARPCSSG